MAKLHTIETVDGFVKENLYEILQTKRCYILLSPDANDLVKSDLLLKYKIYTRGSVEKYKKKGFNKKQDAESFDHAIANWLRKHYPLSQTSAFKHIDGMSYDPTLFDNLSVGEPKKSHQCRYNCATQQCPLRGKQIECSDKCKYKECRNKQSQQVFEWKKFMRLQVISIEKGAGVVALVDLPKGQFVGVVAGEALPLEEGKRRANDDNINHYLFSLSEEAKDAVRYVDANTKGNWIRFFNHSCDPNCIYEHWKAKDRAIMKAFTVKPVKKVGKC